MSDAFGKLVKYHDFFQIETRSQILEDPRATLKRYQLALKDGYVMVHIAKILIVGAAGVGMLGAVRAQWRPLRGHDR